MDCIESYFEKSTEITRWFFWGILTIPLTLTGLLYSFAQGVTSAENNVIIYGIILSVLELFYIVIYNSRFLPSRKMLKLFFITDKSKVNYPENIYLDNEYKFFDGNNEIKLSEFERNSLLKSATNYIKKKFINRMATILDILSLIILLVIIWI